MTRTYQTRSLPTASRVLLLLIIIPNQTPSWKPCVFYINRVGCSIKAKSHWTLWCQSRYSD
jgi:hypothetical protein